MLVPWSQTKINRLDGRISLTCTPMVCSLVFMEHTLTTDTDEMMMLACLNNVTGEELSDELCDVVEALSDELLRVLAASDTLAGEYALAHCIDRGLS